MGHFAVQGIFLAPRQKPCPRSCSELRHCPCCVCGRKTFGEAGVTLAQGRRDTPVAVFTSHLVCKWHHHWHSSAPGAPLCFSIWSQTGSEGAQRALCTDTCLFLQEHQPPGAGVHTTVINLLCSVSDGQWVQCPLPPAH